MGPPLYMRYVVDRNVVMRRVLVFYTLITTPSLAPRDLWVPYQCTACGPFRKLVLKFNF